MAEYKINGTLLAAQPTSGQWLDRDEIGITGNGHGVYPSLRSFQIRWDFMTYSQFDEVHDFFESNNITGTVVVNIPKYKSTTYEFFAYSGAVLREPQVGELYEQHVSDVTLIIARIQV